MPVLPTIPLGIPNVPTGAPPKGAALDEPKGEAAGAAEPKGIQLEEPKPPKPVELAVAPKGETGAGVPKGDGALTGAVNGFA